MVGIYRLVIVEDERDVKNRLVNMIEKSGDGFEIAAAYENGIDAYDGILSDNPDLILTDIRIPYINGIELSKKVRAVFPLIKIIIITGYNEFDYAKEAANLGVIGFISKPVTLENIRGLLKKAEDSLNGEYLTASNLSELSDFYARSQPIIRENDLYRLSKMTDVAPAFRLRLRNNGIELDYNYFVMCMFDFDETPDGDAERYDYAFSAIRKSISEDLPEMAGAPASSNVREPLGFDFFTRYEKLCLLIKSGAPPDIKELERRLERAILRASRYSDTPLSVGISNVRDGCGDFAAMSKEAERALEYRSVMGGQKVFYFGNAEPAAAVLPADENAIRELGYILHSRPAAECVGRIENIRKAAGGAPGAVFYTATSILNVLIKACDDPGGLFAAYAGGPDEMYRKLFGMKTDDEIFDFLKEAARAVRGVNDGVITDNVERNLRKVISYMETHFCDPDINFETLAREVNYSVSYISALLKREKGASFVKILTDFRIEKAKELLANPALKIIDIAERLGYNDSYYFSHCFKKRVGVSPKEFRESEKNT